MYSKFGQFIDGKWQTSNNKETYDVINPATEEVIGKASKAAAADVDITGIIKLLDLAQFTGVEKFVYASSGCAIYGSYGEMPLKEDFISLHLTTPYQINKTTGEMYSNFYYHHYGLNTVK